MSLTDFYEEIEDQTYSGYTRFTILVVAIWWRNMNFRGGEKLNQIYKFSQKIKYKKKTRGRYLWSVN